MLAGATPGAVVAAAGVVATGAGALEACTSIIDVSFAWLFGAGEVAIGCDVVLLELVEVTCAPLAGLVSGAGELSCA